MGMPMMRIRSMLVLVGELSMSVGVAVWNAWLYLIPWGM